MTKYNVIGIIVTYKYKIPIHNILLISKYNTEVIVNQHFSRFSLDKTLYSCIEKPISFSIDKINNDTKRSLAIVDRKYVFMSLILEKLHSLLSGEKY